MTVSTDGDPFSFRRFEMILRNKEREPVRGRDCPTWKDGYLWAGDAPGLGIEIDEKLGAKFSLHETREGLKARWSDVRRLDRAAIKQ